MTYIKWSSYIDRIMEIPAFSMLSHKWYKSFGVSLFILTFLILIYSNIKHENTLPQQFQSNYNIQSKNVQLETVETNHAKYKMCWKYETANIEYNLTEYLKDRRTLLLSCCGDVCNTKPNTSESMQWLRLTFFTYSTNHFNEKVRFVCNFKHFNYKWD